MIFSSLKRIKSQSCLFHNPLVLKRSRLRSHPFYETLSSPKRTRSQQFQIIHDPPVSEKDKVSAVSDNSRPARYKVLSEDMVILSIQDFDLMLLGATRWFMVNLLFGVMILSIQDLYLQ